MKLVKSILLSLVLVLFQSSILATNYHIICVAGPHEEIENDFLKQKLFLGLFKKLIKVRNKRSPRNSQIKFESFANKNFANYDIYEWTKKLFKKLVKNKDKNLILIGIGRGSKVIENTLRLFEIEYQESIRGWQQIIGEQLIEKLGIKINEDDFSIVLDLLENLAFGSEDQGLSNSYLKVDLKKIDDQLEPIVGQFDELANKCCSPKVKKIVSTIFSSIGVAGVIALIIFL